MEHKEDVGTRPAVKQQPAGDGAVNRALPEVRPNSPTERTGGHSPATVPLANEADKGQRVQEALALPAVATPSPPPTGGSTRPPQMNPGRRDGHVALHRGEAFPSNPPGPATASGRTSCRRDPAS
ncbi:hypothetical protein JRQ81_011930 [Phrynocephalus forsythii]|uniref:Uncharacterized protein n=1 Tax=Phrynocephalus forsythii TaxID=171643 RepID=A0A9Q1AR07_9SAUR|nr:hypothetical protein JRQ81_011930 [Phrynocephalus forsythii]